MIRNISFIALAFMLAISCVPLKQYQDVKSANEVATQDLEKAKMKSENLAIKTTEQDKEISRLERNLESLKSDTVRLATANWKLQNRNKQLSDEYAELLSQVNSDPNGESSELMEHLQSLHEQLQKREDELLQAEQELETKRLEVEQASAELSNAKSTLEDRNKRLIELERMLAQKDSAMNALKSLVANALTDFTDDELSVHIKDGKVYVSMEENLLFKSGSYQVSDQGKGAIVKIAQVLESKPEILVLVEGHTDNVPYKGTTLLDNWDLSVKRATSVVRIMVANSNISPERITAAGRSKYVPLIDENTAAARSKNRRTEIILAPNLEELLNSVK